MLGPRMLARLLLILLVGASASKGSKPTLRDARDLCAFRSRGAATGELACTLIWRAHQPGEGESPAFGSPMLPG